MKKKSIIGSTLLVSIITLSVKILGLAKQSILASVCGATGETDVFFIATGILVNLSTLIFSAISISLLTMYTDRLTNYGRNSANNLLNAALRVFMPLSIGTALLFVIFAEKIGFILAPGYSQESLFLLAKYIRVMSSAFILWCYYLIINVVLESDKIFLPGRFQGLFQNLFIIIGTLTLYPKFGIDVLVYAFILSGIAQCIFVTWCARHRFKFLFTKVNDSQAIKKLIIIAVPLIVGNAIYEINDIVDKQISVGLGYGNASFLTYGGAVNEIVTGVIVTSVSTVLFSHFVSCVAEGNDEELVLSLQTVLCVLTIVIFPIMIMCLVSGDQLVDILYGRGNFGTTEVISTYGVVAGYAIGFIFQAARSIVVKVFYTYQDTKIPMINGILSVLINIILSIILSRFIGIAGVALATSIAMIISSVLLGINIKKYLPNFKFTGIFLDCIKAFVASVITAFVVLIIKNALDFNKYVDFIVEGIGCVIVYSLVLFLLKPSILHSFLYRVKKIRN